MTALVTLLAYSGLRPSEAIRLRWEDLDFAQQAIKVQRSKTRAGMRCVPMHSSVRDALQQPLRPAGCEWVFPSPKNPGDHIRDFGKAFEKAVKLSGIPYISPYCLRHTFLTWMERSESRRSILREIGGHSRDRHTDHYLHPDWQEKLGAVERLGVPAKSTGVSSGAADDPPLENKATTASRWDGRPVRARTADLYRVKVAL